MSIIKVFKEDTKIKTLIFNKRSDIRKTEIQKDFENFYKNISFKFICDCKKDVDINMNLSKHSHFINIKSSPNNAHLHNFDCLFNVKIIEINETYYSSEEDRYTSNIFNIEKEIINLDLKNKDDDNQRITIRLSHENDKENEVTSISHKYIRYRNYKDFCNMILEKTLMKIHDDIEVDLFIKKCITNLLHQQIIVKRKHMSVSDYNTISKSFAKVEICYSDDLKKLKSKCISKSIYNFINELININKFPVLCIYFEEKFIVKSFFASLIKIDTKVFIDKEEEKKSSEKLKSLQMLLTIKERDIKLLGNESELSTNLTIYTKKNDALTKDIMNLKIELKEVEKMQDKTLFVITNYKKIKAKEELEHKIKESLDEKKTIEDEIHQLKSKLEKIEKLINSKKSIESTIKSIERKLPFVNTKKTKQIVDVQNFIEHNKFDFNL